jgi:alanine racemase
MPRPIEALIHTDALAHNLAPGPRRRARCAGLGGGQGQRLRPRHRTRAFDGLRGADGFALLDLAEAERVRALGWRGPVLLLEGCSSRATWSCARAWTCGTWCTATQQIDWLAAHKTQQPHRVFLKMNSGMNRLGFTARGLPQAWARLNALPQVDEISLMTHFADADGPRGIAHQVAAFDAATQDLPASAACPTARPSCATAG